MNFDLNGTILAGTTTEQRRSWLIDAQAKYALLMTGGQPVSVGYDGKSVTYTAADATKLENWINTLLMSLGMARTRRAIRPYFR